ncbi:MAG: hypothetical protein K2M13_04800 [Muribaculaceae bacterium]|nr:hypothetical protein [Muribaculaceae bacterium]
MNRRNMGITMIVIGAVLLISGIVIVTTKTNPTERKEPFANSTPIENQTNYSYYNSTVANASAVTEPSVTESTVQLEKPSKTTKEDSKAKGNAFEDFVVNLLADWRLKLLDRTQDAVSSAGVVAESCKNPDLHVQQKRGNGEIDYYIECKYRSNWNNGKVTFKEWQLSRYRQFQKENRRKVLFALGVGGTPSSPDTFMLVPLDSIRDNSIQQIKTEFVIKPTPSSLVDYMNSYFTKVFSKAIQKSK